jgi:hypothetical protein
MAPISSTDHFGVLCELDQLCLFHRFPILKQFSNMHDTTYFGHWFNGQLAIGYQQMMGMLNQTNRLPWMQAGES